MSHRPRTCFCLLPPLKVTIALSMGGPTMASMSRACRYSSRMRRRERKPSVLNLSRPGTQRFDSALMRWNSDSFSLSAET